MEREDADSLLAEVRLPTNNPYAEVSSFFAASIMNHPSSAFGVGSAAPPPPPPAAQGAAAGRDWRTSVEQLLSDLTDRNLRENALQELSKVSRSLLLFSRLSLLYFVDLDYREAPSFVHGNLGMQNVCLLVDVCKRSWLVCSHHNNGDWEIGF